MPIVIAAVTVAVTPRTTIATILSRGPIAALRTALGASLFLRPLRPLLFAGFAFIGLGFDSLTLGDLAVGILARAAIAAAMTRATVTLLALAIGSRCGIGSDDRIS